MEEELRQKEGRLMEGELNSLTETCYRRAYFNRRRGVGRKEKKGCDVSFSTTQVPNTTGTNDCIFLMNGIQEGWDHGTASVATSGTSPSSST